jgi:hypothetical protein
MRQDGIVVAGLSGCLDPASGPVSMPSPDPLLQV